MRRLRILCAIALVLIIVVLQKSSLQPQNVRLISATGEVTSIELPFQHSSQRNLENFSIAFDLQKAWISQNTVRVIPDDCVERLTVNNVQQPLQIDARQLCDVDNGFLLKLGHELLPGVNHVEFKLNDVGGWYLRFNLLPSFYDPLFLILNGLAITLLALITVSFINQTRMKAAPLEEKFAAALLLTFAVLVRYLYVFAWHPPGQFVFSDMRSYVDAANALAAGIKDPTVFFQSIGMPVLIALSKKVSASPLELYVWLQLLAGVATVFVGWRATARLFGERTALFALAVLSFHFPLIGYMGFVLAETFFSLFVATLFYLGARNKFPWNVRTSFLAGALFVGASFFKGSNNFFGPLFLVWALLFLVHQGWRQVQMRKRVLLASCAFLLGGEPCTQFTVSARWPVADNLEYRLRPAASILSKESASGKITTTPRACDITRRFLPNWARTPRCIGLTDFTNPVIFGLPDFRACVTTLQS